MPLILSHVSADGVYRIAEVEWDEDGREQVHWTEIIPNQQTFNTIPQVVMEDNQEVKHAIQQWNG